MCVVSFITTPFEQIQPFTVPLTQPFIINRTVVQEEYPWTREIFEEFKALVEALKTLDERLGLKDCEDREKGAWMERVEQRLRALEGIAPELDASIA